MLGCVLQQVSATTLVPEGRHVDLKHQVYACAHLRSCSPTGEAQGALHQGGAVANGGGPPQYDDDEDYEEGGTGMAAPRRGSEVAWTLAFPTCPR